MLKLRRLYRWGGLSQGAALFSISGMFGCLQHQNMRRLFFITHNVNSVRQHLLCWYFFCGFAKWVDVRAEHAVLAL